LTALDQLKKAVGIPLSIKKAGIDQAHFYKKIDPIVSFYVVLRGCGSKTVREASKWTAHKRLDFLEGRTKKRPGQVVENRDTVC
jgi:hypothetical protein